MTDKPAPLMTEKKMTHKNESLLTDSFLRNVPNFSPGVVAIARFPDLKVFYVNRQFEHYLGYSNTDLAGDGLCFNSLLEDYQHDHLRNQLGATSDNVANISSFVIYRLQSRQGKLMPFYLYAAPLPENDTYGKLFYLLLHPDHSRWGMPFTSFDSKEVFLQQFESEHFGTFEWIPEVDKIFWSPGVYRIFEVDDERKELNAAFAKTFIHPNDIERVKEQTKIALQTGEDLNIEFKIVTAHDHIKLMHGMGRIVPDKDGNVQKFVGSIRDITRQRGMEDDLKHKIEALHNSNRDLEEFAYVASHDLQEPLRKITTFSDRLSEKYKNSFTGDGALYLSRIVAAAENMRTLINDLLEFSRVSKTTLPFEPVNLNDVIKAVKTDLELTIEETGTEIHTALLPTVEAIDSQMKQLLNNIIGNAIKFRKPEVSPIINIAVERLPLSANHQYELSDSKPYYKISITDNGIGFEEEYATRIFQVFQRLHGKAEYPGSGVGLAICKKIVEYHHGTIYAENLPGHGARFVFILPQNQYR